MKRKYIAILAVFVFIVFFFSMEARAVDWVLYHSAADGSLAGFYDPQTIKRVSKDIVQVWTEAVYTPKGVSDIIKKLGPKDKDRCKELSYALFLLEYNCSEKKARSLSVIFYNRDGGVIEDSDAAASWEFVTPGSGTEALFNIVCGGR